MSFRLGVDRLSPQILMALASGRQSFEITKEAWHQVDQYRQVVEDTLKTDATRYGINTGFGYLSDVKIGRADLEQLQLNLIRSHACGVGQALEVELVRALLILRIHSFLTGFTGISRACVETLLAFLDNDILPVIPIQGSVGASGDLAPLAHLALALVGEGEVFYRSKRLPAIQVLSSLGIKPYELAPKEGLSLINGTYFMAVVAAKAVVEAQALVRAADGVLALSLDAIRGTLEAFDERIHEVRGQKGQVKVAANIRLLYADPDAIRESHIDCGKVQDPYSFRCAPQVHGAVRDTLTFVEDWIEKELNAVTDNPLCFLNGDILSGGNFHGEPVAMAMDYLAIAMSELASISERRIEKLTNPVMSGLPPFIAKDSGLSSGFMIPHVVAASLVSENKVLSHPASVDSIPTSADKEDHVSMGPIAAVKARKIILHSSKVLAIEALAAAQGLDLLKPLQPSPALVSIYEAIRNLSPACDQDRPLGADTEKVSDWILADGIYNTLTDKGYQIL